MSAVTLTAGNRERPAMPATEVVELAADASNSTDHARYCIEQARQRIVDGEPLEAQNFVNHAEYHANRALDALRAVVARLTGLLEDDPMGTDEHTRREIIRQRDLAAAAACQAAATKADIIAVRSCVDRLLLAVAHA